MTGMANSPERIVISNTDLTSAQVEDYLAIQQNLRREMGEIEQTPLLFRILFSSWFYLSMASGLGAFVAWCATEPFFDDHQENNVVGILIFPAVAGCVGLFLGA